MTSDTTLEKIYEAIDRCIKETNLDPKTTNIVDVLNHCLDINSKYEKLTYAFYINKVKTKPTKSLQKFMDEIEQIIETE
jgi:hypothetical protein